jgi:hypothetical protein
MLADGDRIELAGAARSQLCALPAIRGSGDRASSDCGSAVHGDARAEALESFDRVYLSAALEKNTAQRVSHRPLLSMHRQSLQKMLKRLELAYEDGQRSETP